MNKEKSVSVIDSLSHFIETPVSGNVMPILICFLVMVGCLCGILYVQMTYLQSAIDQASVQLQEVNKSLKGIETVLSKGH